MDENINNAPNHDPHENGEKKHRSVRDIKNGDKSKLNVRRSASETTQHLSKTGRGYRSKKRTTMALWFVGIIIILFIFFGISAIFDGADITIHPKSATVSVNDEFTSYTQATASELQHDVMTLSEEMSIEVPASGEEHMERRASGIITVFNDFDENDQTLITQTRFETPDGLVYRIDEPLTVPGQKVVNGETVPGSISVRVYADEPGEQYNIGETTFTVPGFEGDPRYDAFHAESETAMTGGFVGTQRTVSTEDKEQATEQLTANLQAELENNATAQVPEGFVFFDPLMTIEYEELPNENTSDPSTVELKMQGILRAVIFDVEELARHIAREHIAGYNGEEVTLLNPQELTLSTTEEIDPLTSDTINFTLAGSPHILWNVDEASVAESAAGVRRSTIDSILDDFTGIDTAKVTIKPFWKRSLPDDTRDIDISVVIPE